MNQPQDNKTARQIIAVLASVFLVWLIYFGSYLPRQKSKAFIVSLQSMGQLRSVEEVQQSFDIPFSIASPIGQEEAVRHFSSVILSTIQRFGPEQASTSMQLANYVTESFQPIMQRERGMSFNQNLYVLGSLNEVIFIQSKDPKYLLEAKAYYLKGHELSPNRPQFLYGLFDIYRIEKNIPKVIEVSDQILALWPNDEKTKTLTEAFLAQNKATSTKKITP